MAQEITLIKPEDNFGVGIRALSWGEGPVILACHGWQDNAASFEPLAAHLSGHRLVAMDFPGHGMSDARPLPMPYAWADYVSDVLQVVRSLGGGPVKILGHSMGAGVLSLFAGTFPELVSRAVFVEGLGPFSDDDPGDPKNLRAYCETRAQFQEDTHSTYPTLEAAAQARIKAGWMEEASASLIVGRGFREVEGGVERRSSSVLRWPSAVRMTEEQVVGVLKRISAPTLLVLGDNGLKLPQKYKDRITQLGGVQRVDLPGGHHLHMDQAGVVGPRILEFFEATS